MHEMTMAQSIVNTVLKASKKEKAKKVEKIYIEAGELAFHTKGQLRFWIKEGLKNTIAAAAKLSIVVTKPEILCRDCGFKGRYIIKDHAAHVSVFACPKCKSMSTEIVKGNEYVIRNIEIQR